MPPSSVCPWYWLFCISQLVLLRLCINHRRLSQIALWNMLSCWNRINQSSFHIITAPQMAEKKKRSILKSTSVSPDKMYTKLIKTVLSHINALVLEQILGLNSRNRIWCCIKRFTNQKRPPLRFLMTSNTGLSSMPIHFNSRNGSLIPPHFVPLRRSRIILSWKVYDAIVRLGLTSYHQQHSNTLPFSWLRYWLRFSINA